MKIIDLLNKIANGEEVPKKIIIANSYYEYDENVDYKSKDGKYLFDSYIEINKIDLNLEVEILEKKIPERVLNAEVFDVPKLNNMELSNIALTNKEDIKIIKDTLNEVLDYLKSKGE